MHRSLTRSQPQLHGHAWAWALLSIFAALLLAWSISSLGDDAPRVFDALPFLLVVGTAALFLRYEHTHRGLSFFSPLTMAMIAYVVMFGLVPIADVWFDHPAVNGPGWSLAAWLVWPCLVLMIAGYRVAWLVWPADTPRVSSHSWSEGRARFLGALGIGIGIAALLAALGGPAGVIRLTNQFADRYDFVTPSSLLLAAVSLSAPAIALRGASWVRHPTRRGTLAIVLLWLPPALLVSGYLGQRWRDLSILVALAALVHLGHRRIPKRWMAVFGATLVAFFLIVGFQRNVVGTTQTLEPLGGEQFYYNYVGSGHELGQFRDFVVTLEGVPDALDFQYGATFASVIPGAPFETGGALFTETFFPLAQYASYPTPLLGELYLNFSYPGIVVGILLYGALLGGLEVYFRRNRHALGALAVYTYSLLPVALILRGSFTTFAGFYVVGLLALVVSLRFVTRGGHRSSGKAT